MEINTTKNLVDTFQKVKFQLLKKVLKILALVHVEFVNLKRFQFRFQNSMARFWRLHQTPVDTYLTHWITPTQRIQPMATRVSVWVAGFQADYRCAGEIFYCIFTMLKYLIDSLCTVDSIAVGQSSAHGESRNP